MSSLSAAYAALLCAIVVAGCSSIRDRGVATVDLEGLWIAQDLPCAAGRRDVYLSVRQEHRRLTAHSATESDCIAIGALVLDCNLPAEAIESGALPLTMRCELTVPTPRAVAVTLLSADRAVLLFADNSVQLQRSTLNPKPMAEPPTVAPPAGASAGEPSAPTGESVPPKAGSGGVVAMSQPTGGAGEASRAGAGAVGADVGGIAGRSVPPSSGSGGMPGGAGTAGARGGSGGTSSLAGRSATAAGSGGSTGATAGAAASGGSASIPPPDLGDEFWSCLTVDDQCVCVTTTSTFLAGVNCIQKHPCCDTRITNETPECNCTRREPDGSCRVYSEWVRVDWCPGQSS